MIGFLRRIFFGVAVPIKAERVPHRDEAPRIFARLFASDDGQLAISYLRAYLHGRVAGPQASEGELRYLDGQRGFLQFIGQLVEQGKRQSF